KLKIFVLIKLVCAAGGPWRKCTISICFKSSNTLMSFKFFSRKWTMGFVARACQTVGTGAPAAGGGTGFGGNTGGLGAGGGTTGGLTTGLAGVGFKAAS